MIIRDKYENIDTTGFPDPFKKSTPEETITALRNQLKRHQTFLRGIEPYLAQDGYTGFVENIQDLLQFNIEE